jgi:cell division protein FtsI/penicillin-binding protein 2
LDCSHPRGLGPVDAQTALAHSCNHFFVTLSEHLPMDSLLYAFSRAGFNSPTGKWRTEVSGAVQLPQSTSSLQLMSIGEANIVTTPLALAEAYRKLALRLKAARGGMPELAIVSRGLEAAVREGTGRLAAVPEMRVAGKTGTSAGHAWFAGFAPAENPEIVAVVFLEQGTGGSDAAPAAGRIFSAYAKSRARR